MVLFIKWEVSITSHIQVHSLSTQSKLNRMQNPNPEVTLDPSLLANSWSNNSPVLSIQPTQVNYSLLASLSTASLISILIISSSDYWFVSLVISFSSFFPSNLSSMLLPMPKNKSEATLLFVKNPQKPLLAKTANRDQIYSPAWNKKIQTENK